MIISSSFSYLFFHWRCFNVSLFRQCSIVVLRCSTVLPLFWRCSVVPVVFYGKPSLTYVQNKFVPQSSLCASFICLCALFIRFVLFSFGYAFFLFRYVTILSGQALFSFRYMLFPLFALFMRSFYVLFLCVLFSMPRLQELYYC